MTMLTLTRSGFALPGTSLNFKTGTWRVQRPEHQHKAAPCHNACPAGEDAQAYLAKVDEGKLQEAWEIIVSVNPLPAVTGRVCHHPCESSCNRRRYDEPIAIHNVERFLGDTAIREGWAYPVEKPKRNASRVAVVGAGPSGISCAYHLLRLGHQVDLFDELPEAGGILRTALPPYRLPREVLAAEIERVLATGIHFKPQQKLGRDMSLDELQATYAAVYLAPGNQKAREWSIDHVTQKDLKVGLDMLKEWVSVGNLPEVKSVAIVGGGNTAVDLSRILRRVGVADVHVVTHQAMPGAPEPASALMTAIPREIQQAIEEGVIFHPHRGIRRLILRGERVVGVELVHMKKIDKSGTGKLETVAFEGTETILHVDQVIPAIGQEVEPLGLESIVRNKTRIDVGPHGEVEGKPGLFAGGDARRGSPGTVTDAVGDGRRAATAIHHRILGQDTPPAETARAMAAFEGLNLNYYEPAPRQREDVLPVEERKGYEEIELGLSSTQAGIEARRCFSCGNCFGCDNCWTLCPDEAVLKTKELAFDGSHYVFDYDYCKGCGLCANECPCGFIAMQEDY